MLIKPESATEKRIFALVLIIFFALGLAMKEALLGVLHYLFLEGGYRYSEEVTDERNMVSRKLLEAVGYHFVGIKEGVFISKKNETITEAIYHLDKVDFLSAENQ